MSAHATGFLPERLRPGTRIQRTHRARRSRVFTVLLAPALLLLLPWWRLQLVTLQGADVVPEAAIRTIECLQGTPLVAVDLDWIRQRLEIWPAVAAVDVRLDLPATVHVSVKPARACASVAAGSGWHGVSADGQPTGPLTGPLAPRLCVLDGEPDSLRRGLAVARRLEQAIGARVETVTEVMPGDFTVELALAARAVVVHVAAAATPAELAWCEAIAHCTSVPSWVDLRASRRVVVAGALAAEGGEHD